MNELGFLTTHVGNEKHGAPARGSSDSDVLEFAQRSRQIIVTSNHDMILICAEAGQQFVWLDPRGRQYDRTEQVLLVFSQIRQREKLLAATTDGCVRSMRTKCYGITPSEAARLAEARMRALRRRKRSHTAPALGPLLTTERDVP